MEHAAEFVEETMASAGAGIAGGSGALRGCAGLGARGRGGASRGAGRSAGITASAEQTAKSRTERRTARVARRDVRRTRRGVARGRCRMVSGQQGRGQEHERCIHGTSSVGRFQASGAEGWTADQSPETSPRKELVSLPNTVCSKGGSASLTIKHRPSFARAPRLREFCFKFFAPNLPVVADGSKA